MFSNQIIKVTDILEVEGALRSLIRSRYPDIVVEPGSALNDLVIRSMGYLAAAIKAESDQVKERLYINKLQYSTESNSQILLEDLASNFLVSVDDTPPHRGLVSFIFTSPVDRVIPASILLTRGDTAVAVKLFDSSSDISLTADDYVTIGTGEEALYSYTTLMVSIGDGEVLPGEFNTSTAFGTSLHKIENRITFLGMTDTDFSRSDLVSKMTHAQTLRGFHSRDSIQATILNEGIPNLKKVVGIGAGDSEMARDVIPNTLSGSRFHSLGMVNIVVSSEIELVASALDPNNMVTPDRAIVAIASVNRDGSNLAIVSDYGTARYIRTYDTTTGITSITSSSITAGENLPPDSVSILVSDEDNKLLNGSSTLGKYTITTAPNESGATGIELWVDNNVPIIQALVDSDQYNTLGSDTKVMASTLVEVLIPKITIKPVIGYSSTSINISSVKRSIVNLINTWTRQYSLPVNEIVTSISLLFGGTISNVCIAEDIIYIANLPDGRSLGYVTDDYITVEDVTKQLIPGTTTSDELLDLQISDRVVQYRCNPNNIVIEVVDV